MTSHVARSRGRKSLPWAQDVTPRRNWKLSAVSLSAVSLGAAALFGAAVLGATGCAAQAGGPAPASTANPAPVGELCRSVLGISPAIRRYQDCTASLAQSAARLDRARALQAARNACLAKGASAGPGGLPECELKMVSAVGAAASERPPAPAETPVKSYAYASWREIRQREQLACARLGLEPVRQDFADCVASLDVALSASEHSAH